MLEIALVSERGGLFNNKKIHCVPTITMGVPAAHELKYQDGGLRRLFLEIPDADQKLKWMHALQAGTLEPLQRMFDAYPREALQLFGVRYTLVTKEDFAFVLKRKAEIAERLGHLWQPGPGWCAHHGALHLHTSCAPRGPLHGHPCALSADRVSGNVSIHAVFAGRGGWNDRGPGHCCTLVESRGLSD